MLKRIKRFFVRRNARRVLCRRMGLQRNTPDRVLCYLANTCGGPDDKFYAQLLG